MTEGRDEIVVAAAVLLDEAGRMLVVRKRGTDSFMQPGGKVEAGESFADALLREIEEEIGVVLTPGSIASCGVFRAEAANETGKIVVAHVFHAVLGSIPIACAAEIEEHAWVELAYEASLPLAPLTRLHLIPLARSLPREALNDAC